MEPRAHHILIGLFTLATAVALMVFALWLGKAGSDGEQVYYDIVFNEDVSGLSEGSAVLYTGIAVGQVASLQLDRDDPSKVWTRIRIRENTPIRATTTARISLANITGASVILLENDDPDSPPLPSSDENIPVIATKPSPFNQLKTSGEELLVNITQLVNNASDIFSRQNNDNLAKTLANLEQSTAAIAGQKDTISQGIGDIAQTSRELRETVAQANRLMAQVNREFEVHGSQLFARADQSLAALEELSTNLNGLVDDNKEALSQSIHGLADIGPVIKELEDVIINLNDITSRLAENPSGYLLNGEQIREYQP